MAEVQVGQLQAALEAVGFWPEEQVAESKPPEEWRKEASRMVQELRGPHLVALTWVAIALFVAQEQLAD